MLTLLLCNALLRQHEDNLGIHRSCMHSVWVLPTMLKQAEIVSSFKQPEIVLMHAMDCRPGKRCCDMWQDLHDVECETL